MPLSIPDFALWSAAMCQCQQRRAVLVLAAKALASGDGTGVSAAVSQVATSIREDMAAARAATVSVFAARFAGLRR